MASLDGDKLRVSYYLSRSETWPDKRCGLIRGVVSLDGDKLVVSYYLSRSETWPDKKGVASLDGDNLLVFHYLKSGLKKGLI